MAAIRLSASSVLVPEQSAAMYSRYEGSRDAVSASASPCVNSKTFTSFTRMVEISPSGAPQQSLYFFPEPHPQGSLRPVLLLIVPSGSEVYPSHNAQRTISAKVGNARTWGNYGRSDSVTIMGVWSDGFSCARGPLSISQPSSRSASVGDNKK